MLGISWEAWGPCFIWLKTQLCSGLAVFHCLMVPKRPCRGWCSGSMLTTHRTTVGPSWQRLPDGQQGCPFFSFSLPLCKAAAQLPQQTPLFASFPPSHSNTFFQGSVSHANSSVRSSDGRAHRFVFHLHTPWSHHPGQNTEHVHTLEASFVPPPRHQPAPGCPRKPAVTAQASLECVPVCLASLIYHKIYRLQPCCCTRKQLLLCIAM